MSPKQNYVHQLYILISKDYESFFFSEPVSKSSTINFVNLYKVQIDFLRNTK